MMSLNRHDAEAMVRFLAWRIGVKAPKLRAMRCDAQREHYRPWDRTISLAAKGTEDWVILHEMAHHVLEARKPRLNKQERIQLRGVWRRDSVRPSRPGSWNLTTREERIVHGPAFVAALVDLIKAWDYSYPWSNEYTCVKSEAKRMGFDVETHCRRCGGRFSYHSSAESCECR